MRAAAPDAIGYRRHQGRQAAGTPPTLRTTPGGEWGAGARAGRAGAPELERLAWKRRGRTVGHMGTRTTIAIAAVAAAAAALTGCSSDSSQEARVPPTVATAPTPWADQIFGGVAEDGPAPLDDEVAGRLARLALDADALDDPDAATSDTHVGADGAALFAAATPDGAGAGELESQFLGALLRDIAGTDGTDRVVRVALFDSPEAAAAAHMLIDGPLEAGAEEVTGATSSLEGAAAYTYTRRDADGATAPVRVVRATAGDALIEVGIVGDAATAAAVDQLAAAQLDHAD